MSQPISNGEAVNGHRSGIVVLSGNPRRGSRTLGAARQVAESLTDFVPGEQIEEIELADVAAELFAPEHPRADKVLRTVAQARILVVATPIYKASYTGLLKAFADLYQAGDLRGVVAVPVVVAGDRAHLLAGEVHLRPLLVELGANVPAPTIALQQDTLGDLTPTLGVWVEQNRGVLTLALAGDVAGAGSLVGTGGAP